MTQDCKSQDEIESLLADYCVAARSAAKSKKVSKTTLLGFGAAAAGGLFTFNQADADVVHSGKGIGPIVLNGGDRAEIDIDLDGDFDMTFRQNRGFLSASGVLPLMGVYGTDDYFNGYGNNRTYAGRFVGTGTNFYATFFRIAKLSFGNTISFGNAIDKGLYRPNYFGFMGLASNGNTYTDPWGIFGANAGSPVTGFVGFRFAQSWTGTVYQGYNRQPVLALGWLKIRLEAQPDLSDGTLTILDFAYENMGNPIRAGQVPEPNATCVVALATLALGAAGIRRRRRASKDSLASIDVDNERCCTALRSPQGRVGL